VIAWNKVDFPTLASPTYELLNVSIYLGSWIPLEGSLVVSHTIPLFRLFPGRPSSIFSSLTAFLGGIFFLELANVREVIRNGTGGVQWVCSTRLIPVAVLAAARSKLWVIETNKQLLDRKEVVLVQWRNLRSLKFGR